MCYISMCTHGSPVAAQCGNWDQTPVLCKSRAAKLSL